MSHRTTAELAVLALALLLALGLAALSIAALLSGGITSGNLLLVIPSLLIALPLIFGVGGALGRRSRDGA